MKIGFAFPLTQLHWWLGAGIVAVAVLVVVLRALEKRRGERLRRFIDLALAPRLLAGCDANARRPLFWLTVLGFIFLFVTFAQPHWGQAWHEVEQVGHDIIVCLDTSESMRAANPLPNRLERAKQKILSMLDRTSGDRFGLVAFSGDAALQCPLTHDHGYFKAVLDAVDTDTVSTEGTDIAAAIREAVFTFKEEDERTDSFNKDARAILLISDGESLAEDAVDAAELASEYCRVYVLGVGDPRGAEVTYPEWMMRYERVRESNRKHITRLDEETLTKIALAGNGAYARSTLDNVDIDKLHNSFLQMSARNMSSDVRLRLVNRYQWPLAGALACFAAEGLWLAVIPWRRNRRLKREEARHA